MKKELNMKTVVNLYTEAYNMIQSHYSILNNMYYTKEDMTELMQSFEIDYTSIKEKIYKQLDTTKIVNSDANCLIDIIELKANEYYSKFARIYSLKISDDYLD